LKDDHATTINGLYASGTDCLGVLLTEKKAYVTYGGLAQGWAFTSGKLAGASAAGEALAR
jgi:fumarate reductase flavoprotein subunit